MSKSIKPQIDELGSVLSNLNKIAMSLDDARKARIMPDFFEYLSPTNVHTLEQQNSRLKEIITIYESIFLKIYKSVENMMETLENLKD